MKTRVLFAVPAAAFLLFIAWFGGLYFEILAGLIAICTIWEVHRILGQAGAPGFYAASLCIAGLMWFAIYLPDWFVLSASGILLLVTILAIIGLDNKYSSQWLSSLFAGLYAPVGFLMLVYIRQLGENPDGFWLILCFFLMIWGNDVFAYFGGKNFGKRPLAPKISPKKTWEGFWFGFLGAATGFIIAFFIAGDFPLSFLAIIPSVIIVSTAGPLGDITESSLKRKAGMKDSSSLLPGHGGFFDRFDSMILSSPFIFFLFYYLMTFN